MCFPQNDVDLVRDSFNGCTRYACQYKKVVVNMENSEVVYLGRSFNSRHLGILVVEGSRRSKANYWLLLVLGKVYFRWV